MSAGMDFAQYAPELVFVEPESGRDVLPCRDGGGQCDQRLVDCRVGRCLPGKAPGYLLIRLRLAMSHSANSLRGTLRHYVISPILT